jgi:hypothetical protein
LEWNNIEYRRGKYYLDGSKEPISSERIRLFISRREEELCLRR